MSAFRIQDRVFAAHLDRNLARITINSVPRPYDVELCHSDDPSFTVGQVVGAVPQPMLLVDRAVWRRWLAGLPALQTLPRMEMDAVEENKSIDSVLRIVEFLLAHGATKHATLLVIGGGIVQDVAAFACAMYKRGLPWIFVPTTLLAQGDSGIGAKASLNHGSTKNLLALFSAPRRVVIDTGFLGSLSDAAMMSGMGEIFRLHVTGGPEFLAAYQEAAAGLRGSARYRALLAGALAVKRAVIEHDEFELDLRRALNYGHSLGHAFEALTEYHIPHGTAVVLGMLVENEIAFRRGALSTRDRDAILAAARPIINRAMVDELARARAEGLMALLRQDKKTVGEVLKLAAPCSIGHIKFIDVPLQERESSFVWDCVRTVISAF